MAIRVVRERFAGLLVLTALIWPGWVLAVSPMGAKRGAGEEKGLALTAPPAVIAIQTGDAFSVTVGVLGGIPPYMYQWERNTGGGWVSVPDDGPNPVVLYPGARHITLNRDIAGTRAETLRFGRAFKDNGGAVCSPPSPVVALDAGEYRLLVEDSLGEHATSSSTQVVIDDSAINIVVYPETDAPKYVGDTATYSVTVAGGHGPYVTYPPEGYHFAWEVNHVSVSTCTTLGCVNTLLFSAELAHEGAVVVHAYDHYTDHTVETDSGDRPAVLTVRNEVSATRPAMSHRNVGQDMPFSTTAGGGYPPYTYQWQRQQGADLVDLAPGEQSSGSYIASVTGAQLLIQSVQLADEGYYACVVTDSVGTGTGSRGISGKGYLSVTYPLELSAVTLISSSTGQALLYEGGNFRIGVTATGGKTPYQYNWKKNGAPFYTGVNAQLNFTNARREHSGFYTCIVEDSGWDPDAESEAGLDVRVFIDLTITSDPEPYQQANVEESAMFQVSASGGWVVEPQTLRYQWQFKGPAAGDFSDLTDGEWVSGAQSPELHISPLRLADHGQYRCRVRDWGPGPQEVFSEAGVLDVTNYLRIRAENQPRDRTVYAGDTILLEVTLSGGVLPYGYAWTKLGAGTMGAGKELVFSPAEQEHAGRYYATCSDSGGNPAVVSRTAEVAVYPPVTLDALSDAGAYEGHSAEFKTMAWNGIPPVTYQWYGNLADGTFRPLVEYEYGITGVHSPTLRIAHVSIAMNGALFRCVASAQASDDLESPLARRQAATRDAVLRTAAPMTIEPPLRQRVYVGEAPDPSFVMQITLLGGGRPAAYVWERGLQGQGNYGTVPGSGCCGEVTSGNAVPLTVDPAQEQAGEYDYRVRVSDGIGVMASEGVGVEFDTRLKISAHPKDVLAGLGRTARFRVSVEGGLGKLTYSWEKSAGKGWESIQEGMDAELVLTKIKESDGALYRCVIYDQGSSISGSSEPVVTKEARLTVGTAAPVASRAGLLGLVVILCGVFVIAAGNVRCRNATGIERE